MFPSNKWEYVKFDRRKKNTYSWALHAVNRFAFNANHHIPVQTNHCVHLRKKNSPKLAVTMYHNEKRNINNITPDAGGVCFSFFFSSRATVLSLWLIEYGSFVLGYIDRENRKSLQSICDSLSVCLLWLARLSLSWLLIKQRTSRWWSIYLRQAHYHANHPM